MAAEPNQLSVQEYLRLERLAETRNEYLDGQLVAMTGGTMRHGFVIGNLVGELKRQLKGRSCQIAPNDLRVHIPSANVYTYPDVVVVCGEPRLEDRYADTVLNPTLLVEVLSPSTEAYDRGKKLKWYQSLESLSEYLLVSQSSPRVEQFVRQQNGPWLFTAAEGLEAVLPLPSIQIDLVLAEIYENIVFD
ncbi:MAG TPA: Uma2 family endonuclease [Thermoanaerobaculia bacterium]|jgi:Uma2 family endonuclease|nr:Uma2 family endonuclease [Thermoanaerobaculia bacterium]